MERRQKRTGVFQSTPSAWRETSRLRESANRYRISIHSLRMEGDAGWLRPVDPEMNFNPLPPHGGRHLRNCLDDTHEYFNPLPPHGGRLGVVFSVSVNAVISIHSLRMEGDTSPSINIPESESFQSTPSAWRETLPNFEHLERWMTFQSTPSAWRETWLTF